MKKLLLSISLITLLSSTKCFADWEFCSYSVQTTTDSWDIYVRKTQTSPPNPGERPPTFQFRFTYYIGGVPNVTSWQPLPSNGFIGVSGLGGGISDIQVRSVDNFSTTPSLPILYFVPNC